MGHRCGGNCLRKQGRRSECLNCNRYRENRRKTIVAGGKRRRLSQHMLANLRTNRHDGINRERVAYVLDNWVVRGIYNNERGDSRVHYAFVPEIGNVVRVAVSMDDKEIITAFQNSRARQSLFAGDFTYFTDQVKLREMEVR